MDSNLNNNVNSELNTKSNNYSKLIIASLAILLIGAIGFICYDKFINTEKPPVPTPTASTTPSDSEDDIIDFDNQNEPLLFLQLTKYNKIIKIGDNTIKLRINDEDDVGVYINDVKHNNDGGVDALNAYVTSDFIFFTGHGEGFEVEGEGYQDYITYAVDTKGNRISINNDSDLIVDSFYPLRNIRMKNGEIIADGLKFSDADNCTPTKLVIKYENNNITIAPKN